MKQLLQEFANEQAKVALIEKFITDHGGVLPEEEEEE